jgi:protein-disulfide isomerase
MSSMNDPDESRSGDVRAAAREKARQLRTTQQRKDRRNRTLLSGGIVLGVLAIAAIVAVVIMGAIRPTVPGPKNMASDGVVVGSGLKVKATPALAADANPIPSTPATNGSSVDIRIYADYLCKLCGEFQRTNLKQLQPLVKDGAVTVEMHPVAIYTSHSAGTRYSLRAANAAACVANYSPKSFWAFNQSLFEHQPAEGGPGLTDDQLTKLAEAAGASPADVDSCVGDGRFKTWVGNASDRALSGPIPNSSVKKMTNALLVLVNGKPYTGSLTNADDFKAFVLQAQGDEYSSTSTPTPSPSAGS